jgi:hypothetical protein
MPLMNQGKVHFPGASGSPGALQGLRRAGDTVTVRLSPQVPLSNDGGIITLLDAQGLEVDGVSYTRADARKPGWTIVF